MFEGIPGVEVMYQREGSNGDEGDAECKYE